MSLSLKKAKREKAKARITLQGTSGAGKTLSALYIAYGMTKDWGKIAVIDSERGRALFYADRSDLPFPTGEFLHCDLEPPYSVDRYIEAMKLCEEAVGEDGVVIIDSASHAWFGEGGVLETKENIAGQRGKTDFSAWSDAGKIQNRFVDNIMALNCNSITTLRSKTEYAQEKDPETGKSTIKKLGLAPVQRDNFDYEQTLVLDIDKDTHIASISKDNTFLDSEGWRGVVTPELGERLKDWLCNGVEPETFLCEKCGQKIKSAEGKNGLLSPKQVADNSKEMFGTVMCMDCVMKTMQEQQNNNEEK